MKAGRELDALVAEKVIGLVLTSPVDPRFDHSVGTNRDGSSAKRNFCRWPDGREHWIPFFSTDISDAWQVVEKLRELRANEKPYNGIVIQTFPTQGWSVVVAGTIVYSDSLPEAICLAALKAVGVEVERCI